MWIRTLSILVGLAFASSCHAGPTNPANPLSTSESAVQERISFEDEKATRTERKQCEAAGGDVRRAGLLGWETCILPYADAGRTCSDSSDCLGQCRVAGSGVEPDAPTTGTCQINDSPFGCYQTVDQGRAGYTLCVD